MALAIGGVLLLAISARIQVPWWPVPFTMQTFAVLLLGAAYGPVLGTATVLTYLAAGVAGAPILATAPGPAALTGPTGGYLAGFLPAAFLAGRVAARGWLRDPVYGRAGLAAADALIFLPGVLWLSGFVGLHAALSTGLAHFLPGEAAKIILVGLTLRLLKR